MAWRLQAAGGRRLTGSAAACGLRCHIVMPDDQAAEKGQLLERFGATVERVKPAAIVHADHYCNVARRRAAEAANGVYADQFETESNFRAHYLHTGPEIWEQTHGTLHAFVMSAGTGGTIAGVSQCLKERDPRVRVVLADPQGSSLYNKVIRPALLALFVRRPCPTALPLFLPR